MCLIKNNDGRYDCAGMPHQKRHTLSYDIQGSNEVTDNI
jgi:hypothetical protein